MPFRKFFLLILCSISIQLRAQNYITVSGSVTDKTTAEKLSGATVSFRGIRSHATIADSEGRYTLKIWANQAYVLTVSYVGHETYKRNVRYTENAVHNVKLTDNTRLSEVVVIAKEGRGPVSTSVIGRDAMEHLQPTSIADLMELLPGGYSKDPNMGQANTIELRETGAMSAVGRSLRNNNYAISSLGTQFIVDGAPINTDANLQHSPLSDTQRSVMGYSAENNRNITNKGVDMRAIGTDDIERVEVVRGIPSVEYGNMTSGIVNIRKIRRPIPFTARFKADGYSKLISVGKGVSAGKHSVLNFDAGYLDSKIDPTNNLENYKRLNGSVRYTYRKENKAYKWHWDAGADYTGSFDNAKADPDLNYGRIEEYRADYNRMALTNSIGFAWPKRLLKELEVNTALSLQLDRLHQRRLVAPQRYGIVPTNFEDGEHEAGAVYAEYVTDYLSDGKPFDAYLKAKGVLQFNSGKTVEHKVKFGLNWDYTKNYGRGQVYDMHRPLSIVGWASRPRKYSDIPGLQNLSAFGEENLTWNIAGWRWVAMLGTRVNAMPGLDKRFDMSGKLYIDPRFNFSCRLPYITVGGSPLSITANGGWGITTKNPTLNYLFPDPYYSNFIELAYYDTSNPEANSRFVVMSYKQDPTNYALTPARNRKWEIRLDVDWNDNSLSMGYFTEAMTDGFRYSSTYGVYNYKDYDESKMTAGADWHTLPYTEKQVLDGYQQSSNGSKMVKQGIEFQFTSARIKPLRTRINVSGAWFHTIYTNSQPMFEPVSSVIANQQVSDRYVGLYNWNDGRVNDRLNSNFTFDTQIPEWGFIFTTSAQFMWLVKTQMQDKNGYPIGYISSADGKIHPFTPTDENDIFLKQLIKKYSDTQFIPFTVPMSMIINLKATKQIGKYIKLSFFANKILDYLPDYNSAGRIVRRNASPYFGVEANFRI